MAHKNLHEFISLLETQDELVRIKEYVSPHLEIAEITDRIVKSDGKALLFENNGTNFPVLINAFGSEKRMCLALGVKSWNELQNEIDTLFKQLTSKKTGIFEKIKQLILLKNIASWLPKTLRYKGSCQEIVMHKPDITKLPVLQCWPYDGGPFITLPVVHTKDPNTGSRNVGMYRMQVFSPTETGMHWHLHKGSAKHYHEYKRLGKPMPVSVTLGGDPVYTYVATAPLPENIDEYLLAGFLRKKKVKLVKCITNDLYIPEDVDFVIEGFVDPNEDLITEGPFGDHTGFYSLPDLFPKFHITCITHKKDAVYPATIVGIPPQEDYFMGLATEKIFLNPIRLSLQPEIINMHMPAAGVFHNLVLLNVKKMFEGHIHKIINGLWGAGQMMFTKVMIALDENVDLYNYEEVARKISENVCLNQDVFFSKGPADILDHASEKYAFHGKIALDATQKDHISTYKAIVETEKILNHFPEIKQINDSLIQKNISAVIIAIEKNRKNHIAELAQKLLSEQYLSGIKFCVFIDSLADTYDMHTIVWLVLNNIDPSRDIFILNDTMIIDGTRKTKKHDGFERPWPNVLVMNDETIKSVDDKWNNLGLGEFIESPSLRYKKLLWPGKAEALE